MIKKFENFGSADFYEEIDDKELKQMRSREQDWFTKKEFKDISEHIEKNLNYKFVKNSGWKGISSHCSKSHCDISFQSIGSNIRIEKYEDEWFVLIFRFEDYERNNKGFKCDQFDGLLKAIKDNLNEMDPDFEKFIKEKKKEFRRYGYTKEEIKDEGMWFKK